MSQREDYERDQQILCRISGTDKGKEAVRQFVEALDERFSTGEAVGAGDWNTADRHRKLACATFLFTKWIMNIPPFGSTGYIAPVVTFTAAEKADVMIMVWNIFADTEGDFGPARHTLYYIRRMMTSYLRGLRKQGHASRDTQ